MNLESLLSRTDAPSLFEAHGRRIGRAEFVDSVFRLAHAVKGLPKLAREGFVVIEDQNPIEFYALLFALWHSGYRVILPNLDYIRGAPTFGFHVGAVKVDGKDVVFQENTEACAFAISEDLDTVCFSSGSTGRPKGIVHHHENFLANAEAVTARLPYRGHNSVTPLAPYLVSAVSHFLVHWLSDAGLKFVDFTNIAAALPDIYQSDPECSFMGSPMHIINGLQYINEDKKPKFFFSSGDFMYPLNIKRVLKRFPDTHFFNVYGLAELCGRFLVNDISADTSDAALLIAGKPLPGIDYKIEDGQILVDAQHLFSGYIQDDHFEPASRPHRSGDLAEIRDGGIQLIGRTDDEVKIGGNKVSLKRVERIISGLFPDDVCVVIDFAHPRFGNLLALVIKSDRPLRRSDVIVTLRKALKPHEIPQSLYVVEDIPVTQSLKIDRRALRNNVASLKALQ